MYSNSLRFSRSLLIGIVILVCGSAVSYSQKVLTGLLNQPSAHVTTISGLDRVIVDDVTGFRQNDTILMIQMQGVAILTGQYDYGQITGFVGQPGMHEFMIIQSVNTGTREVVFRRNMLKTYDIRGNIQIVRVPYYNAATVTGTLTCSPWNSTTGKGGVLALIVGRSLTLKGDIDVSGKGFKGGNDVTGDGRCTQVAPVTMNSSYPATFQNAGLKGEGAAIHDYAYTLLYPSNAKGIGPNFTGGGGGNGKYAGGGGGANHGAGGTGGFELISCPARMAGGTGGIVAESAYFPSLVDRIYAGGGGGASTSVTGTAQPGGNGGGIVIIVADSIVGNSHGIISDGADGYTNSGVGGSGGGGGGGTIALSTTNYGSSQLSLIVKGGNGGDNTNPEGYGEGGGGGGGLIWVNTSTSLPASVLVTKNGGNPGNFSNPPSNPATAGDPGETKLAFKVILNGFLFNSIRSSVTGDTLDWICSNVVPKLLTGTLPVGGSGNYSYKWQKIYNPAVIKDTIDILSNTQNYQPVALESNTVYFRRIVTDNVSGLRDISKWVKIIVQPAITGNNIRQDTTICHGQRPFTLTSSPFGSVPQGGDHVSYHYRWIQNYTNNPGDTTTTASGSLDAILYAPPALSQTTYYRRFVKSGRCIDYSPSVKINVLNSVTGNSIIRSDSIICQGLTFVNLGASAAGGGETGNYKYQWQDSIVSSTWKPAAGTNTGTSYSPDTSKFSATVQNRYYRRVVFSGPDSVCQSKSSPLRLTRYPRIKNNSAILNPSDNAICSGSTPSTINGTSPVDGAGPGSYTFLWQQSTNGTSFSPALGTNNAASGSYQPGALTDTTWYRRIVYSGVYKSAPVCTNTSLSIKINVHKPILNNNIALVGGGAAQTLCYGQTPVPMVGTTPAGGTNIPGDYAYLWQYSSDNLTYTSLPSGGTNQNYAPLALTSSVYYRRNVISGACSVSSAPVTYTVLPLIGNNVLSGKPSVCYSRVPDPLTSQDITGGSGVYSYLWEQSTDNGSHWSAASGTNNTLTYQPPALFVHTWYRRTVLSGVSGPCSNVSPVFDISIDPLPASTINAGPDTMIVSPTKIYPLKAVSPVTGETGAWRNLDGGKCQFDDTARYNTWVRNLVPGNNKFLWIVARGNCALKDSVIITLLKNFIPNGFSPNGDKTNDSFIIDGLYLDDNYVDLSILNGAGTEVFSTTNRDGHKWTDWEGKNSKGIDLPEGTYYYMLKITPVKSGASVYKRSGFIILKRY